MYGTEKQICTYVPFFDRTYDCRSLIFSYVLVRKLIITFVHSYICILKNFRPSVCVPYWIFSSVRPSVCVPYLDIFVSPSVSSLIFISQCLITYNKIFLILVNRITKVYLLVYLNIFNKFDFYICYWINWTWIHSTDLEKELRFNSTVANIFFLNL